MQQIRKCWQLILGLGVLFTSQAWAVFEFDSFDSFEAPTAGQTIIGTPTPGTDQGWNGPWQNNSSYSAPNSKFMTSTEQHYNGAQSLELTERKTPSGDFIQAYRPTDNPANGGVGYAGYQIETYVYIPSGVVNTDTKVYFAAYTTTLSASLSTGVSGSSVNWFVWDNGAYRDTGVPVTSYANNWAKLTLDLDMTAKTYTAYLNDVAVSAGGSSSFDFGTGSSNNLYGIGYAFYNSSSANTRNSVYFDALSIRHKPKVPEAPSWLALVGFLGAGLLPVGWRRFRS